MNPRAVTAATKARGVDVSDVEKTDRLRAALRRKYEADRYALLEEVADGAGFGGKWPRRRYADALVLALWPSDDHVLRGFELKVSRTDWKRELAKPKKSEAVRRYCDRWTLFTFGTKPARLDEIPEAWGWWALGDDDEISVLKKAPNEIPDRWDASFVASMVRRAFEASPSAAFAASLAAAVTRPHVAEMYAIRQRHADTVARLNLRIDELGRAG